MNHTGAVRAGDNSENNGDGMEQGGGKTVRQKNLENWLPITADRKAKWWYSTFHNVTAIVGAGVLGLPFAMSQLGWISGIAAIGGSMLITLYSFWQLIHLHEIVPGRRFDRYHELGSHAFGEIGYWIVMPQQISVQVATDIVYMVTGGKSLKKFFDLAIPSFNAVRQTYFILLFACLQLMLSQTPNFNSLKGVSLLAAVMSFSYSGIAFMASTVKGTEANHHQVSYGSRSNTTSGAVFNIFNAIGTIAFAFAGHSVALEIQATIPSSEEKPSTKPMWRGVMVAYAIVAFCYFSVAISGYWAFGNLVEDDVLVSLERPRWIIATANLMVFFHVLGSYQVFAMPAFDIMESTLVQKLNFTPGHTIRIIARSLYVAFTAIIAMCIPFFGGLLGFFGGLMFAPISFFIPCVIWLRIHTPKKWSFHWTASWIAIIIGTCIMILAPIGGARNLVLSIRTYKFFS